jgi:hypothetical protein
MLSMRSVPALASVLEPGGPAARPSGKARRDAAGSCTSDAGGDF